MGAVGRSFASNSSSLPTTSQGKSTAVNSRIDFPSTFFSQHLFQKAEFYCKTERPDMTVGPILKRAFYSRPTVEVARDLLGKVLVHGPTAGIITETEAYLGGDDLASHSARGVTDRTRIIFGRPGHAYVYLIYGVYECLNLVAEAEGQPG